MPSKPETFRSQQLENSNDNDPEKQDICSTITTIHYTPQPCVS